MTTGPTSVPASCCDDFARVTLDRRRFLAGLAGAGAAGAVTSVFGDAVRQTSYAATTGGNVLVVISFRGGIDGLGLVVPHGDPGYAAARPTIKVPTAALVAGDGFFGMHPAMQPLAWAFEAGELAAVHAVGMPAPNRSHFSAMEQVEDADPTSSERRGWINRMVGLDVGGDPLEAVHLGSGVAPTSLSGRSPHVAAGRLDEIGLVGADGEDRVRRNRQLRTMWKGVPGPLGVAARSTLTTARRASAVASASYTPRNGVTYPTAWPGKDLAMALQDTAQLIRADLGTEVVSIDFGSWDMHADYGTPNGGDMTRMVRAFAEGLDAFLRDLGALRSRVTVATISEFGRRVAENGNRGLDHGWGNVMLLAGGGVKGGQYHGSWPGLGAGTLIAGDLAVTTDYRDVLGEVVARRFPTRPVDKVFPGHRYRPVGVMR
ncbi:MAG: DUF1501 domain-containing protein [Nocardioides sp.]|nr:DUF1501 domain-containing protein [Nocardioides sp.]